MLVPGAGPPGKRFRNELSDPCAEPSLWSARMDGTGTNAPTVALRGSSSPGSRKFLAVPRVNAGKLRGMEISPPTLDAYLDEWFTLQRTRVEPSTWEMYDDVARAYLRPTLGTLRLDQLTVRTLDLHYVRLLEAGGRRGQPLKRRTVEHAHAVLRKALGDAVAAGLLADNPTLRATVPRLAPGEDRLPARLPAWDAADTRAYLAWSANQPLGDLWRVALGTGMRRGELLGLRWEDVDLDVPQVTVTAALASISTGLQLKGTKTGRSRTLFLDDDTAAVIARQPRRDGRWPLVFTGADGSPLSPPWVSDRWRYQWPRLPLPKIPLHGLRHTHATLLLAQGVPIKVVSQRLGHATIAMTMDTYAHVLPAQDRDAATAVARALAL